MFILAHLAGDYVFQTNKIARMKSESIKGILLHSSSVCAAQVVLLSLYGIGGVFAGFAAGVIHFFLDYSKVLMNRLFGRMELIYLFIDQGLHILVIWLFTALFAPRHTFGGSLLPCIRIFIGLVILTHVSTVAVKMLVRDLYVQLKSGPFFKNLKDQWMP
jgi:hypothetical protein